MADDSIPNAPTGTRAAGKRLWDAVLADYVLEQHELGLLCEMVRTTDVLDELNAVIRRDGLIVAGPREQWFREHDNGTLEMVNALYREGFNDLAPDPRRGRR